MAPRDIEVAPVQRGEPQCPLGDARGREVTGDAGALEDRRSRPGGLPGIGLCRQQGRACLLY
jgi:hypothetical protein